MAERYKLTTFQSDAAEPDYMFSDFLLLFFYGSATQYVVDLRFAGPVDVYQTKNRLWISFTERNTSNWFYRIWHIIQLQKTLSEIWTHPETKFSLDIKVLKRRTLYQIQNKIQGTLKRSQ